MSKKYTRSTLILLILITGSQMQAQESEAPLTTSMAKAKDMATAAADNLFKSPEEEIQQRQESEILFKSMPTEKAQRLAEKTSWLEQTGLTEDNWQRLKKAESREKEIGLQESILVDEKGRLWSPIDENEPGRYKIDNQGRKWFVSKPGEKAFITDRKGNHWRNLTPEETLSVWSSPDVPLVVEKWLKQKLDNLSVDDQSPSITSTQTNPLQAEKSPSCAPCSPPCLSSDDAHTTVSGFNGIRVAKGTSDKQINSEITDTTLVESPEYVGLVTSPEKKQKPKEDSLKKHLLKKEKKIEDAIKRNQEFIKYQQKRAATWFRSFRNPLDKFYKSPPEAIAQIQKWLVEAEQELKTLHESDDYIRLIGQYK